MAGRAQLWRVNLRMIYFFGELFMAESDVVQASASSDGGEKIIKVSPEDYSLDTKDSTSLKIICLGDSAVGKSK